LQAVAAEKFVGRYAGKYWALWRILATFAAAVRYVPDISLS